MREYKMMSKLNSAFVITAFFAVTLSLGACNTMEGVGQDLENLGDKIEDSASKNKNY